jgi:hypothetical protein
MPGICPNQLRNMQSARQQVLPALLQGLEELGLDSALPKGYGSLPGWHTYPNPLLAIRSYVNGL